MNQLILAYTSKANWTAIIEGTKRAGESISDFTFSESQTLKEVLTRYQALHPSILIVDLFGLEQKEYDSAIRDIQSFRLLSEQSRIIAVTMDAVEPGNRLLSSLVSMSVWDIVVANTSDDLIEKMAIAIQNPANYRAAARWQRMTVDTERREGQPRVSASKTVEQIHVLEMRPVGRISIAVAGTQPRSGCTSTAIYIARTIANRGLRVALWMNNQEHHSCIGDVYKDAKHNPDGSFLLDGVVFFAGDLADVGDYPYLVIDLGGLTASNYAELKRSTIKLLLSGNKDWELMVLQNYLTQWHKDEEKYKEYKYLFLHSTEADVASTAKHMAGLTCYAVPTLLEPFGTEDAFTALVDGFLDDYLPKQVSRPQPAKRSLFGRR